jgi:proton-dependent oligopeptide transporter, POT family
MTVATLHRDADATTPPVVVAGDRAFFGHPRGLSTLFFTEMWERFSYYGMRALLILFMTAAPASGGLGFDIAAAGAVYGLYTSMVYLASLPGGWLADRLIGQRRAVMWGGIIIASGHFSLALPSLSTFYLGLTLIIIGTGLLKGNISVLVGGLYAQGDKRRDAGFSIYYMGINLGAFLAPLVCGYLGQRVSWHAGFAAAGVGMVLGVTQYVLGGHHLGTTGLKPVSADSPAAAEALRRRTIAGAGVFLVGLVLAGLLIQFGVINVTAPQIATWAGYLLLVGTAVFFGWLYLDRSWTREERRRLYVIGLFFLAAAIFWSVFEQAGSTLNLFADRSVRNEILGRSFPSSFFQSANALFIIAFAPVFAWLWITLGGREPSSPTKFAFGLIGAGLGFAILVPAALSSGSGSTVSPLWLVATYLLHTWAELCLSPVGLSSMTKLAPARIASLVMGIWFLGASVGNYLAGQTAGFYENMPLARLFAAVSVLPIIAGVVFLVLSRRFTRMMGNAS